MMQSFRALLASERFMQDSSRLPSGSRAHQGINLAKGIKPLAWKPRT